MADPKQAKVLLAEIPANDSFKAMEEITFWLESLNRTEGFKLDRRFELLDQLDQAGKNHHRKLNQDYLAQRLQKFQENRLWTTVFEFWRHLGAGYIACVEGYQAGAAGSLSIRGDLPVISARALRALSLQLKWVLLRYGPVDDRVWGDIGRIFLFAESKGFVNKSTQIYPGAHGVSTVTQEFLKAMMLSASSTDGLQPAQLEIAERTIAHFSPQFVFDTKPSDACNYYFDLSMRKPPSRVIKKADITPTMRFFGAGKAAEGLAGLTQTLVAQGVLPSDVNLGGTYDAATVIEVLKHLAMYWSATPPARNSERRRATARLTIVHGFADVLRHADSFGSDSLDFSGEGLESWVVENVSEGGYGALVPAVKGDWLKIGSLLGLKTDAAPHWSAGVVRRITRDEQQARRVGIQVVARTAVPVRLSPVGPGSSVNATREGEGALLLSASPDSNGDISVMLRVDSFTPSQVLEMEVLGRVYVLKSARLVEASQEYDLAKFKFTVKT